MVDWETARLVTGENYCPKIADFVRSAADDVLSLASEKVGDKEKALRLFEGLLKTGIAMGYAGCSRPASGAEHMLVHFWECWELASGRIPDFHGAYVGVATLLVLEQYREFLKKGDRFRLIVNKINIIKGREMPKLPVAQVLWKPEPSLSVSATAWAQKGRAIPVYGTTHADYFFGEVPCGRFLFEDEMDEYEKNTGKVIIETIGDGNPLAVPGCILQGHGVFAWGKDPKSAVHNAVVLEEIAKMAFYTEAIPGKNIRLPEYILNKHYSRKHGKNATYGQR